MVLLAPSIEENYLFNWSNHACLFVCVIFIFSLHRFFSLNVREMRDVWIDITRSLRVGEFFLGFWFFFRGGGECSEKPRKRECLGFFVRFLFALVSYTSPFLSFIDAFSSACVARFCPPNVRDGHWGVVLLLPPYAVKMVSQVYFICSRFWMMDTARRPCHLI